MENYLMNKQFVRIGKANGGIFQYKRVADGKPCGERLWAVDYRDARGKKARKMGLETRAGAVAFFNENDVSATAGPVLAPERMTFKKAVEEYRLDRERNGKRTTSYYHLERFLAIFGDTPIRKISPARISAALEAITNEHGLSLSTRNRALMQVSGLFTFAKRRRWLRDHPTRDGQVERYAEDNKRTSWFRPAQIHALIEMAHETGRGYLADVIEFAVLTGKRLGEVAGLKRSDFTTDANGRPVLWIGETKNGEPERLPIEGPALELVKRLAKAAKSPSSYLFPGPRGLSSRKAIERNFRKVLLKVAEKNPDWNLTWGRTKTGITFHTLRASFATIGNAAGMSERDLMVAGNWKSRAMLDRYVRRDDDALRAGLGRVGQLVTGSFGETNSEAEKVAAAGKES
jgi:integrase